MNTQIAAAGAVPAAAPEALLKSLRGRYAVKKFDPGARVDPAAWMALEEALMLSPSSYGLQPWKFFLVSDPGLRARLKEVSWGQSQITDADKLVVFAARRDFGPADVERYVARVAAVRGVPAASLGGLRDMMLGAARRPRADVDAWVARQVYIALGVFLAGAAALGVDACPMEGFEPAGYDRLLGLPEKGYTAVVVATAGRRAANDAAALAPKVRFAREDVIERVGS